MGHRAKHLRRNWIPERLEKAEERRLKEARRPIIREVGHPDPEPGS